MTDQILDLQLKLLLLQYGRQRVLSALATSVDCSIGDIEREIRALAEVRKSPSRVRKQIKSILDLADVACQENPTIAEPLKKLAHGFNNRTFLPNLRDVERFLHGVPNRRKSKSREAAAPVVIDVLKKLSKEQLNQLNFETSASSDTDFLELARVIMQAPMDQSDPR